MADETRCPDCGSANIYRPRHTRWLDAYCNECETGFNESYETIKRWVRAALGRSD